MAFENCSTDLGWKILELSLTAAPKIRQRPDPGTMDKEWLLRVKKACNARKLQPTELDGTVVRDIERTPTHRPQRSRSTPCGACACENGGSVGAGWDSTGRRADSAETPR